MCTNCNGNKGSWRAGERGGGGGVWVSVPRHHGLQCAGCETHHPPRKMRNQPNQPCCCFFCIFSLILFFACFNSLSLSSLCSSLILFAVFVFPPSTFCCLPSILCFPLSLFPVSVLLWRDGRTGSCNSAIQGGSHTTKATPPGAPCEIPFLPQHHTPSCAPAPPGTRYPHASDPYHASI